MTVALMFLTSPSQELKKRAEEAQKERADAEKRAREAAEAERKAKEKAEAERKAVQAEVDRQAREKADAERKAKEQRERVEAEERARQAAAVVWRVCQLSALMIRCCMCRLHGRKLKPNNEPKRKQIGRPERRQRLNEKRRNRRRRASEPKQNRKHEMQPSELSRCIACSLDLDCHFCFHPRLLLRPWPRCSPRCR